MPLCEERGVSVVIGGGFNSGILATGAVPGAKYNYAPAPKPIMDRVRAIEAVCTTHDVPLPAAALQFVLAHPAVPSFLRRHPHGRTADAEHRLDRPADPGRILDRAARQGPYPRGSPGSKRVRIAEIRHISVPGAGGIFGGKARGCFFVLCQWVVGRVQQTRLETHCRWTFRAGPAAATASTLAQNANMSKAGRQITAPACGSRRAGRRARPPARRRADGC